MVLDLAGGGLSLALALWLLLLLRVRLRLLLRHHLASTAHVLEVCSHGEERVGSVTILPTGVPMWILAQACDPAVPFAQRGRVAREGGGCNRWKRRVKQSRTLYGITPAGGEEGR